MACLDNSCYECGDCLDQNPCYDNTGCINPTTFECVSLPGDLPSLGITNNMNGREVLEAISTRLATSDDRYVRVSTNDTTAGYLTAKMLGSASLSTSIQTPGGNERLVLDINVSPEAGNTLQKRIGGLYVPTPAVPEQIPLVATDTTTVKFTQSGTMGHTIAASVAVSAATGNRLFTNSDGLFVGSQETTPESVLVANDSPTIDFIQSGTSAHTLTGHVKISTNPSNKITVNGNGLYASPDYPIKGLQVLSSVNSSGWFYISKSDANNPFYGEGPLGSGGSGFASFEGVANGWTLIGQDGINTITGQTFDLYGALRNPSGGFYPSARIFHSQNLVAGANVAFTSNSNGQIVVSAAGAAPSASVSANNGLTANSGNIQLGGNLMQPTTINNGIHSLSVVGTGSEVFSVGVTGGRALGVLSSGKLTLDRYNTNMAFPPTGDPVGYLVVEGDGTVAKVTDAIQTLTASTTTVWDLNAGREAKVLLTQNTTLVINNVKIVSYGTISVQQDSVGGRTITLPPGSKVGKGGGGTITLSSAPNSIDLLCFRWDGTTMFWKKELNFS